ncbi:acetyltransferase [Helicobacter sp.]|uniref:acetyltransferase n=1 Tax=Helicobacter sp. TaxID=218 RepID=UPI0025841A87|nr:acetyltransferase [Helicobacter sp.]MCI7766298.1 acetyltransferase [Helicobacter sp.]
MVRFAIVGAGGHGRVIADIILACGGEIAFVVDDSPQGKILANKNAISPKEFLMLGLQKEIKITLAIGNCQARRAFFEVFKQQGFEIPSLIHSSAIISKSAKISEACVVMPNVVVNAESMIETGVILNTGCVVEHDCKVGEFSHLAPKSALCGGVRIGKDSHIGAGSVVIEGRSVGDGCMIGAGSVVINDIQSFKKVVGNPAKKELQ